MRLACDTFLIVTQEAFYRYPTRYCLLHSPQHSWGIRFFIQIVGKYSDIQELTYENVHEFIDRILIHELDRETNTRKIEIHYSFVGQVDTEQEPTQVVNHDRRNMVDVKSIAI